MLIPVTAKCQYTGKPESLLVPESNIISINTVTSKAVFKRGDKVDVGDVGYDVIQRAQAERIPAPAGVTLRGRPVIYFERDQDEKDISIATMAEDGTIVVSADVGTMLADAYDEWRGEQAPPLSKSCRAMSGKSGKRTPA